MVNFWLDDFTELFNIKNLDFTNMELVKLLNVVSILILVIGIVFTIKHKKKEYFAYSVLLLSLVIMFNSLVNTSSFKSRFAQEPVDSSRSLNFLLNSRLLSTARKNSSKLNVDNILNINKGDIIQITNGLTKESETHVVAGINESIITLLDTLKSDYYVGNTELYKVSDSSPAIVSPPDANQSIQSSGNQSPEQMALSRFPTARLPNGSRHDWNLELATYSAPPGSPGTPGIPGSESTYQYQGQPYGNLKCRKSTPENPMGNLNVTEYSAPPTMYGTCNSTDLVNNDGEIVNNDYLMTDNYEKGISMRVDDLLFHKGNSQSRFAPNAADTLPNNQEAFANFCYRNPSNFVNPKYASIFVNDPEKYKIISKLAKATGTENGGGGGGGGRGN